jgi:hypothetical protein
VNCAALAAQEGDILPQLGRPDFAFSNLDNGAQAGLSYLNGNNWLGNDWWNNAARISKKNQNN